jgi:hypothetical protein
MSNNKQTPKEQAKELVDKMWNIDERYGSIGFHEAKQCAIIHVNEMIKKLVELSDGKFTYLNDVMHYQEVKQEIETYGGGGK